MQLQALVLLSSTPLTRITDGKVFSPAHVEQPFLYSVAQVISLVGWQKLVKSFFFFFFPQSSVHGQDMLINWGETSYAGSQSRIPRPSSGRVQKRTSSGSKPGSRPNSRGQAGQSYITGTAKLKQLASNRASQGVQRRKNNL